MIVSLLNDMGDVVHVTRTSRVLYYMTRPLFYREMVLRSLLRPHQHGRPKGSGSGSHFALAMNGLITKAHGLLIPDFRLRGQLREVGWPTSHVASPWKT